MPKIIINETDTTKSYETLDLHNVVYIPGFSVAYVNPDCAEDNYIPSLTSGVSTGMPCGIPTLCTSLAAFQTYFGSVPPAFSTAQNYPIYKEGSAPVPSEDLPGEAPSEGFDPVALFNEQMFLAGEADPSYCYAVELLRAGIPVVYERINKFSTVAQATSGSAEENYEEVDDIPTSSTVAPVGKLLYHVPSKAVYICVAADAENEEYIWRLLDTSVESVASYFVFDITVPTMYSKLYERFVSGIGEAGPSLLADRNIYDIKFITSGGYPVFEYNTLLETHQYTGEWAINGIAGGMVALCETRGDAVALIDHVNNKYRPLVGAHSVFSSFNGGTSKYRLSSADAALYTPWVQHTGIYSGAFPGSFAYLSTFAESIKANPSWLAVAGPQRGMVPDAVALETNQKITEAIANSFMPANGISINPIIKTSAGYMIWGNRTLLNNPGYDKASSFLNLKELAIEVKKKIYDACKSLMFEQNSDILWINFKAKIVPLLDEMCTSAGISDYRIERIASTKSTKVVAQIILYPIYAVEEFEINVVLSDSEGAIITEG